MTKFKPKILVVDEDKWIEMVCELARQDGVDHILTIPGVWEAVQEYYNNDALNALREEQNGYEEEA